MLFIILLDFCSQPMYFNAVFYVMPFLIGQCQIFPNINYTIDAVKQFAHAETICIVI
jgi:hypothetical protein